MKAMCCRCTAHYAPSEDPDANATFCGSCSRKLETLAREAETYQLQIRSGSVNVTPLNEADARTNREAIRKRLDPATKDTQMKTWRDK